MGKVIEAFREPRLYCQGCRKKLDDPDGMAWCGPCWWNPKNTESAVAGITKDSLAKAFKDFPKTFNTGNPRYGKGN
jgi:hypothetical protein